MSSVSPPRGTLRPSSAQAISRADVLFQELTDVKKRPKSAMGGVQKALFSKSNSTMSMKSDSSFRLDRSFSGSSMTSTKDTMATPSMVSRPSTAPGFRPSLKLKDDPSTAFFPDGKVPTQFRMLQQQAEEEELLIAEQNERLQSFSARSRNLLRFPLRTTNSDISDVALMQNKKVEAMLQKLAVAEIPKAKINAKEDVVRVRRFEAILAEIHQQMAFGMQKQQPSAVPQPQPQPQPVQSQPSQASHHQHQHQHAPSSHQHHAAPTPSEGAHTKGKIRAAIEIDSELKRALLTTQGRLQYKVDKYRHDPGLRGELERRVVSHKKIAKMKMIGTKGVYYIEENKKAQTLSTEEIIAKREETFRERDTKIEQAQQIALETVVAKVNTTIVNHIVHEEKVRLARETRLENERQIVEQRQQRMWLVFTAVVYRFNLMHNLYTKMKQMKARKEQVHSAIDTLAKPFAIFALKRRLMKRYEARIILKRALKPMVRNWLAKRRRAATDLIVKFLRVMVDSRHVVRTISAYRNRIKTCQRAVRSWQIRMDCRLELMLQAWLRVEEGPVKPGKKKTAAAAAKKKAKKTKKTKKKDAGGLSTSGQRAKLTALRELLRERRLQYVSKMIKWEDTSKQLVQEYLEKNEMEPSPDSAAAAALKKLIAVGKLSPKPTFSLFLSGSDIEKLKQKMETP